jgi:hypothetical protein
VPPLRLVASGVGGVGGRCPPAGHPVVSTDLNNLALALQDLGRAGEALPLFQRALAIAEAVYGPDHPSVAYLWWVGAGRPEFARFGMTVHAKGYEVWLDSPDQSIRPPGRKHATVQPDRRRRPPAA